MLSRIFVSNSSLVVSLPLQRRYYLVSIESFCWQTWFLEGWRWLIWVASISVWVTLLIEDIAIHSNIFLGSTSVSHDFGSRKIFLLLNDSSHDPHFSACQNIETLDRIQKISNFSLHGFSRYSTPNMAFQKIILTFFVKLKNYVFELNGFASVPLRFGSRKIFLLLNDSSHDPHFSACQNIETLDRIRKISNFSLHGFSRYLTPNMALQKIILTSFFLFLFPFSSSRSRAMRSPRHNFSKILSNWNEIQQTCSGVNVVVPNTFWVHSVQGFRS